MLNGMLWILRRIARTGVPWEDLPARYGAAGTVSSRFYRRREAGVSDRVLQRLQAQADARGAVDWDPRCADATVVRPPVHRRGTPVQRHRGVTAQSRSSARRSRAVRAAPPPRSGLPTTSPRSPSP